MWKLVVQFVAILLSICVAVTESRSTVTTCDRLAQHGYPCEKYTVATSDDYLLTMFRIPHSHRGDKRNIDNKPAVLLMHCLFSSSDMWLLNGPDNALPYMLADAGYDVWIANVRGTIYSQHSTFLTGSEDFWDFSMDEIAEYDLPATIDYIIAATDQPQIHYVGYSQGTTVFMMLLAKQPSYNDKIKTSHLMCPGVFLCHVKSKPSLFLIDATDRAIFSKIGKITGQQVTTFVRKISPGICKWAESVCVMVMDWITGWGSPYLNRTVMPDLVNVIPIDVSDRQLLQYKQYSRTCEFKAYDFGVEGNMLKYGESHPPVYNLDNVQPKTPIDLYYSDNDLLVSTEDVQVLSEVMGDRVDLHRVKYEKFNHFDFAVAKNIKEVINSCVVDKFEKYEGRPFNGSLCNNFNKKPF